MTGIFPEEYEKLLKNRPKRIWFRNDYLIVLPEHLDSKTVAVFKKMDDKYLKIEGEHHFANFLPDDERPEDVPKY